MTQSIRNEESPNSVTITLDPGGGYRIEEKAREEAAPLAPSYSDYLRVVRGRGTVCMPHASSGAIPSPSVMDTTTVYPSGGNGLTAAGTNLRITEPGYTEHFGLEQGLNCELIPQEEIQNLWNQVLADSSRQVVKQTTDQAKRTEEEKTKKLELLLRLALNAGDLDTAILLFSGLESRQANAVSAGVMNRMQQLQDQRKALVGQMNPSGDQAKDAQNSQKVNAQMSDIATEMSLLQTFLQDLQSHKNEAQQLASNFIKSRHETGMGIIRNMG